MPSRPPSQPSPYRQLGSGGQQPVRVQLILGLIVGLVLVAVPLYLWRRPVPETGADASPGAASVGTADFLSTFDAGASRSRVKLSPIESLRCDGSGSGKTPPERCDRITFFEDGLSTAIRENVACAPSSKEGTTISFVMKIDFRRKKVTLSRGKSSTGSRKAGEELVACVDRALPTAEWGNISHQHTEYVINVKASYPPSETFE